MPELPEVEIMCRGIASTIGACIEEMRIPPSSLRPITIEPSVAEFRCRILGRTIVSVGRSGKRVVVELDSGDRIVIEPRMTGRVLLRGCDTSPLGRFENGARRTEASALLEPLKPFPDAKHLRVVFVVSQGRDRRSRLCGERDRRSRLCGERDRRSRLCGERDQRSRLYEGGTAGELMYWDSRGLGLVRLLAAGDFARRLGPQTLGPDALEITAAELRTRLRTSRRAIKVALLDQAVVAGVGNLYASELLHRAGLHPETPCRCIRPADWRRLHTAMLAVLQEAIAHQGSTLADGTYRTVRGEAGRYQDQHRVYQRAGQLCLQCKNARILRIVQAQRSTFFCPNCQRRRHGGGRADPPGGVTRAPRGRVIR